MTSPRRKQNGFTLIELVISITLLVIIMSICYSSLSGIIRAKSTLDDGRDASALANAVLTRMTRELQLATSGLPLLAPANAPKKGYSSTICMIGDEKKVGGNSNDQITFLAQEGGQYLPDGGTHAGIVQITYRVEQDPDARAGSRRDQSYYLVREEVPYYVRPLEKAYKKAMIFPITKSLVELQFRYFSDDSQSWVKSWGKDPNIRLPKMVEFTIGIKSPQGVVRRYTTTVPLRTAEQ
jgi:prepilin-type N-terminal cleavage/methylation domain-containing protein